MERTISYAEKLAELPKPAELRVVNLKIPPLNKECMVLYNVLSKEECDYFIEETERLGYQSLIGEYSPTYRDNDRVMVRDGGLADLVYKRVKHLFHDRIYQKSNFKPIGLNEMFRFCRYVKGGHFNAHTDAEFIRSNKERSFLTFMIYLNGGLDGGSTNFLESRGKVLERIHPEAGMVLCFDHIMLHEGEALLSGKKYLMRTDVMFKWDEAQ
eukprot:TRINITY_DN15160_c0_g1_i1.p1 TRINITY_DN15160_c0_g1~~TRINITY_DN15160_c0_g1_i1.p1  ORF type:complete len:212 (+),score=28.94 TRINITY_DN15160_c0_g1_i1:63-698(+)